MAADNNISNRSFRLTFSAWWLAWALTQFVVLFNYGVTNTQAFTDSFVCNLTLAACCLLIINNMRFYLPKHEKYWYIIIISVVLSGLWLLNQRWLLWGFFSKDAHYMNMLQSSLGIRFVFGFLMIMCMSVMSLLWRTLQEQKETDERKSSAEKIAKEAELFKLRQQLQPHFLFNSLNSISALTAVQPAQARNMIQQLSDFLRGTLKKEEQQWSTLKEELQYLQLYLDIEKVRFGNRLQTELTVDEDVAQMQLPSLLLQPVVENAIKFGLYDTLEAVTITIKATKEKSNLLVTVANPFDMETAQPLRGTGFGLSSVQRRLFLLFARHDLLQTKANGNIYTTTVVIPQLNITA